MIENSKEGSPKDLRVLVTGATGFIGSFLAERLLDAGDMVFGTYYSNKKQLKEHPKLTMLYCDIKDSLNVSQVVNNTQPDVIFHLAAQTFITASWSDPITTFQTNIMGTANLLEAIRREDVDPVIVIACSSAEYGETANRGLPLKETDPLLPLSPYAVSKVCQDLLGYQYHENFGLKTIRARIFGSIGPRKRGDFCAEFSQQIAAIEAGLQPPVLRVGKLDNARDLRDVRDTVKALILLSEKGSYGEVYNVSTGRAIKIREVLNMLLSLSNVKIRVEEDPSKIRPSDEAIILGDNSKLRTTCGWQPEIELRQTLKDTLDYWRNWVREHGVT